MTSPTKRLIGENGRRVRRQNLRRARKRSARPSGSRLGRTIIVLNLLGLAILIGGTLVSNGLRDSLIKSRLAGLTLQGHLIANVIDQTATQGEPDPALEADAAAGVLQSLSIPKSQRTRLYDAGRVGCWPIPTSSPIESKRPRCHRRDMPGGLSFHIRLGPSAQSD